MNMDALLTPVIRCDYRDKAYGCVRWVKGSPGEPMEALRSQADLDGWTRELSDIDIKEWLCPRHSTASRMRYRRPTAFDRRTNA